MAVSFKIPKQPRKSIDVIDTFLGADFTNSPAGADKNKSPGLKNMIRDVPGKIRKCMGYETVTDYSNYGFYYDDVFTDAYEKVEGTNVTVTVNKHKISFEFTDTADETIEFNPSLFDQTTLASYYEYFGDNNIIEYISGDIKDHTGYIPEWIKGVYVIKDGDTYTLSFDIEGGSEGYTLEDYSLRLVQVEEMDKAISIFPEYGNTYDTEDNLYVYTEDDGSFCFYKYTSGSKTKNILFPRDFGDNDDDPKADRTFLWMKAYQDPNWRQHVPNPYYTYNNETYRVISATYDLTDKMISSDIDRSLFEFIKVLAVRKCEQQGGALIELEPTYFTWYMKVTISNPEAYYETPYMLLKLLPDPSILAENTAFTATRRVADEEEDLSLQINGFHKLRKDEYGLVHVGTKLYRDREVLYEDANNHRSMSWEFDEHLYIVDGKKFLRYGLDTPQSDTKYKQSKQTNEIVVGEEVTLVIKRFNTKGYSLKITSSNTDSPNGKFEVSQDKTTITYTDTLTEVGQTVTFDCSWKYKKKSNSTAQTGSSGIHYLEGISGDPVYRVVPVEDLAYIPLLTIAKSPDGGGEAYYDINLLSPAFTERFLPKQKYDAQGQIIVGVWQDDYYMSFDDLDEVEPIVKKLNLNTGEWVELEYGTDFTVDYSLGLIHFTTAPSIPIDEQGAPIGQAEDTISITAYKTFKDYTDRINKCTIGTLFGVGGANDRLFLSGNPDYINYDWYSGAYMLEEDEQDQQYAQTSFTSPTYYPDTGYSMLGSSASAIVGYSRVSNYLAAHKDKYERDQHIIIREGDMVDSAPTFRIINTLQGAAAVAPYSFGYLATEPLFLTEQGIYAVTAQDITGEKYAQNRSFYLDGKLLEEENLEDAYGFVYNDMYWLCLNDVAYILDGLQPMRSDKAEPYATRQYAGFYRTNIPANVMWEEDGRLFFGTKDGKVKRFYKDKYALESYNDDGEPIEAIWETGDLTGNVFFKNKTLHHIAVKLDSAIAASVSIFVMWRGLWNFVRTDHWRARQFRFSTIQGEWDKFTFSNNHTQKVLPKKVRFKNDDKFRLRLTNNELNESFALYDVGIEFTETDNYTR